MQDTQEIVWQENGTGTPLVLLHGIGSSAASWAAQLAYFGQRHRTIAWNAPGYGGSTPLHEEAPEASAYAQALAGLLDRLGVGQVHLVGHSLGALMAARFAAQYPQRILTLTLASCAIGHAKLPAEERARMLNGRVDDVMTLGPRAMAEKRGPRLLGPRASETAIRKVVDVMASVDPKGYAQAARMLSQGNMLDDVATLPAAMPVQVVYGTADVITPPAANERVAAARPGTPITAIPDGGHAVYVEMPEAFNAVIDAFLEGHDERP
ncbi:MULTISPECIES: alpha/beta hydrolase [unclassified Beijerinckia]|uniref:alpha/beta fold hydrolase n=1 Tax=unclassified Beijerinckia TaxID=2638183 RepID=UPI000894AB8F|nr:MULTISPECIES: alpha/beta hydrolase [unclassified Beijerinckia]MDH7794559.1 pimeloyl-ACP methyl ester carboxylesterase [Beijerinckia sp. GAS462]SEB66569.1 Pimeloyl-ACP methyl ester carboxylesterase [Beijerinckia sp. 28-YEA-48]